MSTHTVNDAVKSVTLTEDGDLHIDVIGVPYGAPDYLGGKDAHGEWFDSQTDTGDLPQVLSYFDHGKSVEVFGEDDPFGKDPIGKAYYIGEIDEGKLYRIAIDRRKKYLQFIKRLAEERLIGASSTPFQRGIDIDASGRINKWPVVEMALTLSEANPAASVTAAGIYAKFLELGDPHMAKNQAVDPVEEPVDSTTEETAEVAVNPITAAVEKSLQGDAPAESTNALTQILEKLVAIEQRIGVVEKSIGDAQASVTAGFSDIQTAFPVLAKHISTALGAQPVVQSPAEKSASQNIANANTNSPRLNTAIPANFPGNH